MDEMEQKVTRHLDYLEAIQPGFKVQRFIEYPCPWISYSKNNLLDYMKDYGMPNHREILYYEIIIDVDADNMPSGGRHTNLIEEELKRRHFKYKRWWSGGTGQHFHINFRLMHMKNLIQHYSTGEVRLALIKEIIPEKLLKIDGSKVCLHNKTLIQIEYMKHRKGGIKTLLSNNDGMNDIPDVVFKKLYDNQQSYEIAKRKRADELSKMTKVQLANLESPECIRFFEGEEIHHTVISGVQDGIYRILFALINFYVRKGEDPSTIEDIMILWRESLPPSWIERSKDKVSNKIIRYMLKKTNGSAGCRYRSLILEDINCTHVCKNCPYRFER